MRRYICLLSCAFLFAGCSLYRSEGRKDFEAEATPLISSSFFKLLNCKKENKLQSWFNQEFPAKSYELLISDDDLEVWKTFQREHVEIRALQRTEGLTCTYLFSNEAVWEQHKEQFIKEIESNTMSAEQGSL